MQWWLSTTKELSLLYCQTIDGKEGRTYSIISADKKAKNKLIRKNSKKIESDSNIELYNIDYPLIRLHRWILVEKSLSSPQNYWCWVRWGWGFIVF
jgi:hypothetical protein